jgi:transposase
MKPYRYIQLNSINYKAVETAYKTDKRHHVRTKCQVLLFSHQGYKISELGTMFNKPCETIRKWFNKWEAEGLAGFSIKAGRGVKPKIDAKNEDLIAFIKKKSKNNP